MGKHAKESGPMADLHVSDRPATGEHVRTHGPECGCAECITVRLTGWKIGGAL